MKIAITGHRPDKLGNDYDLTSPLIQKIKAEIIRELGLYFLMPECDKLITGMALGIDTLFAQISIELELPFIAAIPCIGQEKCWPEKSRKRYSEILVNNLCTVVHVSTIGYTSFCMQKRNEWMVGECDILIAVWDGSSGGTSNCVQYAKKVGKPIIIINPDKFR